jgi:hypothetical protein
MLGMILLSGWIDQRPDFHNLPLRSGGAYALFSASGKKREGQGALNVRKALPACLLDAGGTSSPFREDEGIRVRSRRILSQWKS